MNHKLYSIHESIKYWVKQLHEVLNGQGTALDIKHYSGQLSLVLVSYRDEANVSLHHHENGEFGYYDSNNAFHCLVRTPYAQHIDFGWACMFKAIHS